MVGGGWKLRFGFGLVCVFLPVRVSVRLVCSFAWGGGGGSEVPVRFVVARYGRKIDTLKSQVHSSHCAWV